MAEKAHRFSFEGKLALIVAGVVVVMSAITAVAFAVTDSLVLSMLFSVAIGLPLSLWALRVFMAPVNDLIHALIGGVASLRDNDFSISIADVRQDELGELVKVYNQLGAILRDERQNLFQRELLLDTIIQSTPLALILTNARGAIVYSNSAAKALFSSGKRLEGHSLPDVLATVPQSLRDAMTGGRDGLFTVEAGTETETYHLSQRRFDLNAQRHQLYLVKRLTREINRQEVATWKKVIRVIGHELNNSLAPISSLAHSGSLVVDKPDSASLSGIFATIEERANHLNAFINGYAKFAKLPNPQPRRVDWEDFIGSLQTAITFRVSGELPEQAGYFDPVQFEQVIINLIKNAHESGSDEADVELQVSHLGNQQIIRIRDRGSGMTEQVMNNALLPFYSTKQTGSGLGLPLCREIVEAHGGRFTLANRSEGGLVVELTLPAASAALAEPGQAHAAG
jgi:nitrogen fixation/metabolism regulation signal transduction histidine kinase